MAVTQLNTRANQNAFSIALCFVTTKRCLSRTSPPGSYAVRTVLGSEKYESNNAEQDFDKEEQKEPRNIQYKFRSRRFLDMAKLKVVAGNGGNGCCSFRREKYIDKGGPDGGDGGRGGDVIAVAMSNRSSLNGIRYMYAARSGDHGKGKMMHGKRGDDSLVEVPVGTVVRRRQMPTEEEPEPPWIDEFDLDVEGTRAVLCAGGRGGKGNPHFATSTNRAPRKATRGEPGQLFQVQMELKTLADVGLVGMPNAGKSTFLRAVSNAHPRVAPYPFTTLNPFIGTIDYRDYYQLTVADIPGLVTGAHRNIGLGHQFLRHIERASVLVYIVDISGGAVGEQRFIDDDDRGLGQSVGTSQKAFQKLQQSNDQIDWDEEQMDQVLSTNRSPWDDLEALQTELELFRPGLSKRVSVVLANKMDLNHDEIAESNLQILKSRTTLPVIPISAMKGENVTAVTAWLRQQIETLKPAKKPSKDYL